MSPGAVAASTTRRVLTSDREDGVSDAGVHPLTARGRVDVRSVTGEEHAPGAVAVDEADVRPPQRRPLRLVQADVGVSGPPLENRLQVREGELRVLSRRDAGLV